VADITEARKTLEPLLARWDDQAQAWERTKGMEDIAAECRTQADAIRALLDDHEQAESALAQAREENERLRQTSYLIDCMSLQARIKAALAEAAPLLKPEAQAFLKNPHIVDIYCRKDGREWSMSGEFLWRIVKALKGEK